MLEWQEVILNEKYKVIYSPKINTYLNVFDILLT